MNSVINDLIDLGICEIKKQKNKEKIEEDIIKPLLDYITEKIKPYVIGTTIFLTVIIILIISILLLILIKPTTK